MSIPKKSLIANRQAAKKAIVATNSTQDAKEPTAVRSNVHSNVRVHSNVKSNMRSNVRSNVHLD
jgi:hypothetical protein